MMVTMMVMRKKKEPICFNVDDQRLYFTLCMTLSTASSIRESISWYAISRGVHLKLVKNDSTRIRG